ncbi:probable aldo-keto reductase 1 isoform X1 [Populus nigra]|uniref:probable aldo-keto reductase 1 isoform X1 n=1 Tax=Populus nigra TaxID=3691 RepID=UPI002B270530|nr:probable aldo-keto reductase 1 isoform X1 [Populus nigra]
MAEEQKVIIPRVKLGNQGLEVSKLGFGCMGLSGMYNAPLPEEVGISIIKEAYSKGITFFDTADVYGPHTNEILVGKALKHLPREKIQLATKFGVVRNSSDIKNPAINGSPEYIRACCDASLKRLDLEYIDLYYQHRVDTSVPIEETVCSFPFFHYVTVQTNCVHYLISNPITLSWQMGELKKLVEEGKVKYIGLSEASPDTIKRAHAVHPISAVQMEWSLWSRDIEEEIIPLCRELGIAVVPYSPIGRGFFGGRAVVESLPSESVLKIYPRFTEENIEKNKVFYTRIEKLAAKHGCTPAQLALAWVLNQGDDVVPIPGTTKIKNLYDNIGSLQVKLTKEDLKEISDAVPINEVAGVRNALFQFTWKFADTPQPKSSQV